MLSWFTAGGWVMWFLLVIGVWAVAAAADFARRPDPERLERIACLSRALGWGVVGGVANDLCAVGMTIPNRPEWAHSPDLALLVLQGVGESMTPAILGSAMLSVVALLTAAGHSRLRVRGVAP